MSSSGGLGADAAAFRLITDIAGATPQPQDSARIMELVVSAIGETSPVTLAVGLAAHAATLAHLAADARGQTIAELLAEYAAVASLARYQVESEHDDG
jgi:hypothetical protein